MDSQALNQDWDMIEASDNSSVSCIVSSGGHTQTSPSQKAGDGSLKLTLYADRNGSPEVAIRFGDYVENKAVQP